MPAAPVNIMTLFTTMYSYVETAIATSVASFGSGLVAFVAAPLALAATIYFLLLGFAVLRGAIQAPLRGGTSRFVIWTAAVGTNGQQRPERCRKVY